jgi:hypothetical protein
LRRISASHWDEGFAVAHSSSWPGAAARLQLETESNGLVLCVQFREEQRGGQDTGEGGRVPCLGIETREMRTSMLIWSAPFCFSTRNAIATVVSCQHGKRAGNSQLAARCFAVGFVPDERTPDERFVKSSTAPHESCAPACAPGISPAGRRQRI